MFRKIYRKLAPNPLNQLLKKANRNNKKHFLLYWNRGLGDIALGLYAIVHKIKEQVPNAKITFLIRKDLEQGFSLFKGVNYIVAKDWKRGIRYTEKEVAKHALDENDFDEIITWPDPSYWVKWQHGKIVPKLIWKKEFEKSLEKLGIDPNQKYIACQPLCETNYGLWRNLPHQSYQKLFDALKDQKILLLGKSPSPEFSGDHILDLRGKTDLYTLLTLMKTRVKTLLVPDSGILSMTYYLNEQFPIKVISLWADPYHGILKQNVSSPNKKLIHYPLIADNKDLSNLSVEKILKTINF